MHNPLPGFFFMLGSARIPGVALEFGAVDPWGSMEARIRRLQTGRQGKYGYSDDRDRWFRRSDRGGSGVVDLMIPVS